MKAQIITTAHTVGVNDEQLDIFYFFELQQMEVYVNGSLLIQATFHPSRAILSYTNVVDVATYYYDTYLRKERAREKERERLEQDQTNNKNNNP